MSYIATQNKDLYLILIARRNSSLVATILQEHLWGTTGTKVSTKTTQNNFHPVHLYAHRCDLSFFNSGSLCCPQKVSTRTSLVGMWWMMQCALHKQPWTYNLTKGRLWSGENLAFLKILHLYMRESDLWGKVVIWASMSTNNHTELYLIWWFRDIGIKSSHLLTSFIL